MNKHLVRRWLCYDCYNKTKLKFDKPITRYSQTFRNVNNMTNLETRACSRRRDWFSVRFETIIYTLGSDSTFNLDRCLFFYYRRSWERRCLARKQVEANGSKIDTSTFR